MPKEKVKIKEDEDSEEEEEENKRCKAIDDDDEERVEKEDEETNEEIDKKKKKKKKRRFEKEDEDDDEEPEEETEEVTEKAGLEQSPEESATQSTTEGHTTTPGKMTGKPQNVFVPQSQIGGERMGSGTTPGEETYTGKSLSNSAKPELLKSPLFVELSGQIGEFQKSVAKKLEAVEKSVADRLLNLQKAVDKIEKFYKQPFYKAIDENVTPEGVMKKSIKEQLEEGKIRFSA